MLPTGTTICLFFAVAATVSGFSTTNRRHVRIPTSSLKVTTYGRGAEIWPECNEAPIQLADSFPGGIIPNEVMDTLSRISLPIEPVVKADLEEKKAFRPIRRLFASPSSIDKTPTAIAVALLASGLIRPADVGIVTVLSGYLAVLFYFARSPRADGISPHVPAVPPQGHVPDLVANPLGLSFTNSKSYDSWLKVGAVLSLLAPLVSIVRCTVVVAGTTQTVAAKACARPLFLLCCQAVAESISRNVMVRVCVCVCVYKDCDSL